MEDSSPHSRHTYRGRGGGGKTGTYTCSGGSVGTNTALGSNNSQETKDRSEKATAKERGASKIGVQMEKNNNMQAPQVHQKQDEVAQGTKSIPTPQDPS
jgi:hypothetical protein